MAAYSGLYHLSGMSENDATSHHDGCVQNRAGHAVADFVGTAYFNSDHFPAHPCPPRRAEEGMSEWESGLRLRLTRHGRDTKIGWACGG